MEELRKLNDMVTKIGLKLEKGRYGDKSSCSVEFFNGEKVEFTDKNKQWYDVLMAYKVCGKSKVLLKWKSLTLLTLLTMLLTTKKQPL